MAYDFGRFFRDAWNSLGQAAAGAAAGGQAGTLLGSVVPGVGNAVGGAVGVGTGFVGGLVKSLFDNSAANTAQDAEEAARAKAQAAAVAAEAQAAEAAARSNQYQAGLAERFNPLIARLTQDAAKMGATRDASFLNRMNSTNDYIQDFGRSNQTIRDLQGQGVFNTLIQNLRDEANPFAAQGKVDQATSARAGADFANQGAKLRSELASRGMLGGPGEIAALSGLNAQQGASMFDTGVERILAEADFDANRNQQVRDYMQAGGDRSDRMAMALAEALRDPTKLNTLNNIYQQDVNNAVGTNQAALQGNQVYSQAQVAGIDAANSAANAQGGVYNRYIADADRFQAEQDRINKDAANTWSGLSTFVTQMPKGVAQNAADAAGMFGRFLGGSMVEKQTQPYQQPEQIASRYSQPNTNPRPGVGGRQMGGTGLPYNRRLG